MGVPSCDLSRVCANLPRPTPIFVPYLVFALPFMEELYDSNPVLNLAAARRVNWRFRDGEVDLGGGRKVGHPSGDITSTRTGAQVSQPQILPSVFTKPEWKVNTPRLGIPSQGAHRYGFHLDICHGSTLEVVSGLFGARKCH